jgi:hypothetical protein
MSDQNGLSRVAPADSFDPTSGAGKVLLVDENGNPVTIVSQADQKVLRVSYLPPAANVFFGFGEHEYSGTKTNADLWGGPTDIQPEPDTGGYALYIKSDSTDDDTTGDGAQTIHVHYLDTAGAEQTVSADCNGTAEVDTGIADCMFVNQHHVIDHNGTGLVATGNIDCLAGSGGAVVSRITAAGNQSMSTMKQVPAGKTLVVTGWHVYGTAATTKIANLRLRSSAHDGVLNAGVYHFHDAARVKDSSSGHIPLQFTCPSLATVKISAWTTGTIDCTGRWSGYLENN